MDDLADKSNKMSLKEREDVPMEIGRTDRPGCAQCADCNVCDGSSDRPTSDQCATCDVCHRRSDRPGCDQCADCDGRTDRPGCDQCDQCTPHLTNAPIATRELTAPRLISIHAQATLYHNVILQSPLLIVSSRRGDCWRILK